MPQKIVYVFDLGLPCSISEQREIRLVKDSGLSFPTPIGEVVRIHLNPRLEWWMKVRGHYHLENKNGSWGDYRLDFVEDEDAHPGEPNLEGPNLLDMSHKEDARTKERLLQYIAFLKRNGWKEPPLLTPHAPQEPRSRGALVFI